MDAELSIQCCGKHDGDLHRTLPDFLPSFPLSLLLGWGEQTSFSSFGRNGDSCLLILFESWKGCQSNINKDIYREKKGCRYFLMDEEKYLFWSVQIPYINLLERIQQTVWGPISAGLPGNPYRDGKQMRVCLRVTRSNGYRVVWYRCGVFSTEQFSWPRPCPRQPCWLAILRPSMKEASVMRTNL